MKKCGWCTRVLFLLMGIFPALSWSAGMDTTTYRQILDHPYLPLKKPALIMVSGLVNHPGKEELFYLILGIGFLLALIKGAFPKYFKSLFSLFFQSSLRQKQTREQISQENLGAWMVQLLFVLSMGLFITLLVQWKQWSSLPFWLLFAWSAGFLAVLYLGKFLLLQFIGWVTQHQAAAEKYLFGVSLVNRIMGIAILPFVLLMAFHTDPIFLEQTFLVAMGMLVLLFGYRFLVSFSAIRSELDLNPGHYLLGLVALEWLPMALIYKGLMIYLAMTKTGTKTKAAASVTSLKKILVSQPRPESEKSPYFELERKYKVELVFHPFIVLEGIPAKEFRKQKIDIAQYTGIIFTSRNAIDHFFRMSEEMKVSIGQDTKYFCITEAVALYLQKFILYRKRKVFYGADGTNKSLFDVINKHKEAEKFLYVCSENQQDSEIVNWLKNHRCDFQLGFMYRSISNNIKPVLDQSEFDVICFFTPSGVKSLLDNCPAFKQNGTVMTAFGSNTSKAVADAGFRLDIQVPSPQKPSMVAALDQHLSALKLNRK
ncbi:MAG: DUF4271 domain-containing protein [Sphingobacteriia bacterium]|nr:MAG: DUF4271 domain-containing protein [Sphingobacteriia bacterium]